MSRAVVNSRMATNRVRRVVEGGKSYLVAPVSLINPGVLAGSDGPLYYPPDEVKASAPKWDRVPLTLNHPKCPETTRNLSSKAPGVLDRVGVGELRSPRFTDKLRAEAWFDEARTKTIAPTVYADLTAGRPVEVSTGLFVDNVPGSGTDWKGRRYDTVTRNYRPDHLAVLVGEKGACSVADGCGLLVNQTTPAQDAALKKAREAKRRNSLKATTDLEEHRKRVGMLRTNTSRIRSIQNSGKTNNPEGCNQHTGPGCGVGKGKRYVKSIDLATASAKKLNDHIEAYRVKISAHGDALIAAGRGHETHAETITKQDPLSVAYAADSKVLSDAIHERRRRKEYHGSDKPITRNSDLTANVWSVAARLKAILARKKKDALDGVNDLRDRAAEAIRRKAGAVADRMAGKKPAEAGRVATAIARRAKPAVAKRAKVTQTAKRIQTAKRLPDRKPGPVKPPMKKMLGNRPVPADGKKPTGTYGLKAEDTKAATDAAKKLTAAKVKAAQDRVKAAREKADLGKRKPKPASRGRAVRDKYAGRNPRAERRKPSKRKETIQSAGKTLATTGHTIKPARYDLKTKTALYDVTGPDGKTVRMTAEQVQAEVKGRRKKSRTK